MSITKRQFELGINDSIQRWMEDVYSFLKANPNEAFSTEEIGKQWEEIAHSGTERGHFTHALEALIRVRAAESRFVGSELYYAFGDEVDTESWVSTTVRL